MGGLVVPAVFEGLPFSLTVLFGELDGSFPNHPADPIQLENLKDLQRAVLDLSADVGLAFDGDADRVFLVDDKGVPVSGSTTTAIVAAGILDRHPGETVVHNLICSRAVPEIIREHGGIPVRTRVGHSFIKQVMAETGAIFGGEHSAHYYFRDNWRADSGSIAALLVLEQLGRAGVPLSELRKPFERYVQSGEINSRVDDPAGIDRAGRRGVLGPAQDRLDGLTVDCGDWWFNLRPSNTEPLLRLNLEAPDTAQCDAAHRRGARAHPGGRLARRTRAAGSTGGIVPLVSRGMALDPETARDPRVPAGQGPAAVSRRRAGALQPAAAPPLPGARRRHPRSADRRRGDRRRRRARPACEEGGERRRQAHVRAVTRRAGGDTDAQTVTRDTLDFSRRRRAARAARARARGCGRRCHADALPGRRLDPQRRRARHGRFGHLGRCRRGRVQRRAARYRSPS